MHYFSSSEVSAHQFAPFFPRWISPGETRTNRKIRVTNMPMVPMKVGPNSQNVGL